MIDAKALIDLFRKAYDERWGYIWGKRGQVWTQEAQDAATRKQTVQYGQKWVGRRVADCSGLFAWAYKELGASIYHGSNTIWKKYLSGKGEIVPGVVLKPGTAVFQVKGGNRHHIGLYVGGGVVIEARGTDDGVITSAPGDWDEWGELADVDYTGLAPEPITASRKTLRRGSRGDAVRQVQSILLSNGCDVGEKGADGIFGKATEKAVKAFQAERDLKADGVVGPLTWAALAQAVGAPAARFTVTITGVSAGDATALLEAWGPRATATEETEGR